MILTDHIIRLAIVSGEILIEPYCSNCLGSNSYDVHLSKHLAVYKSPIIDAKADNDLEHFEISEDGFILEPNKLYLGSTIEYTETHLHVPFLEGKSSTGRLGVSIHATAGKGDIGFCGHWTLEISCVQPVRIYAGMPIGQLIYFQTQGECLNPYNKKDSAKYTNQSYKPVGSQMFMNFSTKPSARKL